MEAKYVWTDDMEEQEWFKALTFSRQQELIDQRERDDIRGCIVGLWALMVTVFAIWGAVLSTYLLWRVL